MDNFSQEIQDSLFDMFSSDGWRYFVEDVQSNMKSINHLDNLTGEQQLGFRQGQLAVLRGIVMYEDTIRAAANESAEEDT